MLGAIIGDVVGSAHEFENDVKKDFTFFDAEGTFTDDTVTSIAVAKALIECLPIDYSVEGLEKVSQKTKEHLLKMFERYPYREYGEKYYDWCIGLNKYEPYHSLGNGSAMRVSSVGWIANTTEEVKLLSRAVTRITHNHPEGMKGAEAIAMCVYLAKERYNKEYIKEQMIKEYYPEIKDLDYDDLVVNYTFDCTCPGSVPQAIYCFLISNSFEDAIRKAVSIGGDTDTVAAMAGSIAEAYYKKEEKTQTLIDLGIDLYITDDLKEDIDEWKKVIEYETTKKNERLAIIKKVVDEYDPINLLASAPPDEYDVEIREIERTLYHNKTFNNLEKIISAIFFGFFEEFISNEMAKKMAKDIEKGFMLK